MTASDQREPALHDQDEATATATRRSAVSHNQDAALAPAEAIGRYQVLGLIGSGGMGQVYSAYDPTLDRRVALKLVHHHASAARLAREAKALARLNHPHVVTVHEVATHDERTLIAMEYVDGYTLKEWLARNPADGSPRHLEQALDLLLQAGRGLEAAHDVGLVHRDFKPANVLVGKDGRARVADFGISVSASSSLEGQTTRDEYQHDEKSDEKLTATGTTVGTPAYMAPEQLERGSISELSDQYAFCLTSLEVLTGQRPSRPVLDIHEGAVPRTLANALQRGLSDRPRKRHKNLTKLLLVVEAQLAKLQGRRRSRSRTLRIMGWGLLAAAGLTGGYLLVEHHRTQQCIEEGRAIRELWNESERAAVRAGLHASGVPYAETTATSTVTMIDTFAKSWNDTAIRACNGRNTHATTDSEANTIQWCLDQRRIQLSLLTSAATHADEAIVRHVASAATAIQSPEECLDVDEFTTPPPPVLQRPPLIRLHAQRLTARLLWETDRFAQALDAARSLEEGAKGIDDGSLYAEALVIQALSLDSLEGAQKAAPQLENAYFASAHSDQWGLAAESAVRLVAVYGTDLVELDVGKRWARHAEEAARRAGPSAKLIEASRLIALGHLHERDRNFQRGVELAEEARDIVLDHLGKSHPRTITASSNLARAYVDARDIDKAILLSKEALDLSTRVLGRTHPSTISARQALGAAHFRDGAVDEALQQWQLLLDTPHTPAGQRGDILLNMAIALQDRGRNDEVREYLGEARKAYSTAPAEHALSLGNVDATLAHLELKEGHPTKAIMAAKRAVAQIESAVGPNHPELLGTLSTLALLQSETGDTAAALRTNKRAIAVMETNGIPDHDRNAQLVLTRAAASARDSGDNLAAISFSERAISGREVDPVSTEDFVDLAWNRRDLAVALWDANSGAGRDRARARDVMLQAEREFLEHKGSGLEHVGLAEARQWLRTHTLDP